MKTKTLMKTSAKILVIVLSIGCVVDLTLQAAQPKKEAAAAAPA